MPTPTPATETITDGRLLRGQRTRRTVLRAAVDAASVHGLDGVTFGGLSTATGQSKAGVQTLFGSKQALQLATAELAAQLFHESVVLPADDDAAGPAGLDSLRALIERWLAYAGEPLFEGGCFWTATAAEYDSLAGPVHDLLVQHRASWRALLEQHVQGAVDAGEVVVDDAALAAFQIDAVLQATNIDLRLGDASAVDRARRAIDRVLDL